MAKLKTFGLSGFAHRDAADLLGGQYKVELMVIATSKKRAQELLKNAWVTFLVLDIVPETSQLRTALVQRHHLDEREGVYAFKRGSGPADVLIELLPKGSSALVSWLAQPVEAIKSNQ